MLSRLIITICQQVSRMTLSLIVPYKRASFFSSFYQRNSGKENVLQKRMKASLTVEATMVVPLFLFLMMTLLYMLEIVRIQSDYWEKLHGQVTEQCFAKYETVYGKQEKADMGTDREGDGNVFVEITYEIPSFIGFLPIESRVFTEACFGHGFVGYRKQDVQWNGQQTEIYVYVTPNGKKYHFSENCTYLKVVVYAAKSQEIEDLRNASGEIYYPCNFCHSAKGGLVYYTTWGNRYHAQSDCPALKHTVLIIPLSQANGRSACSKCG